MLNLLDKKMFLDTKNKEDLISQLLWVLSPDFKIKYGIKGCKEAILSFVQGYVPIRYQINPGGLYRARINKDAYGNPVDYFMHTDNLWAPPIEATKKGRCNDKGERILYCSNHPITSIVELNPIENEYITIITYELDSKINISPVSMVGIESLYKNDNTLREIIKNHYRSLISNPALNNIKIVDEFIAREFQLIVKGRNNDFLYNSTIAWSQLSFEKNPSNCIIYPTASSGIGNSNWALKPDYAKDLLIPKKADRGKIEKIQGNGLFYDIVWDCTADLNGHGDILWEEITPLREHITHLRVSDDPFKPKSVN